MKSMPLLILSTLLAAPTFAASRADETAHYQAIHVNAPISISVSDDIDRNRRAFRNSNFDGRELDQVDAVIRTLPGSLRNYLVENGIEVAESTATRNLHISIDEVDGLFTIRAKADIIVVAFACYNLEWGVR